jgi:hypothetical protein
VQDGWPRHGGFHIPDKTEYEDPTFPAERLRMVGCKSKLRERATQYLNEARRVGIKYHVTLDPDVTDSVLEELHAHGLRVYMPETLIRERYAGRAAGSLIGTIETLLNDLRAAVAQV